MKELPVFDLPPLHLKVPHVHWRMFYETMHRYMGKVYIDSQTIHYAGEIGHRIERAARVFKRRGRRRSGRPLTVFLPRELLRWLAPVIERIAHEAVVDAAHPPGELPPLFRIYSATERLDFARYMHDLSLRFCVECNKTMVDLIGEIQT